MKKSILPLLLLTLFVGQTLLADWPCQTTQNVVVSINSGIQWNPRIASDGKSGAVVVWQDRRTGIVDKVFVQRINNLGNAMWQDGGIPLSLSSAYQVFPQISGDGTGGSFVTWMENRNAVDYDIFVQRVTSNGLTLWNPGGNIVSNYGGHQYYPMIVRDLGGQDGVIIVWQDQRSGNYDIYAQKFTGLGQAMWSSGGEVVIQMNGDQVNPSVISDGLGGAIITWTDFRSESGTSDVFCQRLLSDGRLAWVREGVPIAALTNDQLAPQLVTDGKNGAIIAWQDRRSASIDKIFAQRIDKDGIQRWMENGVPLAYSAGIQATPKLVSDNLGGAIVVWQDNRTGNDYDIYAQYINQYGQMKWSTEGLSVCVMNGQQYNPTLVFEGSSALITWQDKRNEVDFDIFAQRINLFGVALWSQNGNPLHTNSFDQVNPQLDTDLLRGGIVVWTDYRVGGGNTDLFAQRIGSNGKMAGGCYRSFTQDSLAQRSLRVRTPIPGTRALRVHMPNTGNVRDTVWKRGAFQDGLIVGVDRPIRSRDYGWIWISIPHNVRRALPMRGTPRPFRYLSYRDFNSVLRNPHAARYTNSLVGELIALKHNIAASDSRVTDPGFGDLVYRDPTGRPNPLTNRSMRQIVPFLDSALTFWREYTWLNYAQADTALKAINKAFSARVDTFSTIPLRIKPVKALFSVPNLIPNPDTALMAPPIVYSPMTIDEEDNITEPFEYDLLQNYPNPFNPATTIEFYLTERAKTSLRVYNTLGQEVAVLLDNVDLEAGTQTFDFDASSLTSGVYFYQLVMEQFPTNADEEVYPVTVMKKMVLMK
ncbi:MAG: T9SS type A sorting domain-containing protein [Ignavibacteriae bacterium]|nr:T9SS type A sorting domain-containing protein [Ignavibacteriota bacterium]